MSQNTEKAKNGKIKLEAKPEPSTMIMVNQPMVRDFSTGGGHHAGDTIVEGDDKIVTRKWQGYPPQNLNLVGKSHPSDAGSGATAVHGHGDVRHAGALAQHALREAAAQPASSRHGQVDRCLEGEEDAGCGLRPDAGELAEDSPDARGTFLPGRDCGHRRGARPRIMAEDAV